MRSNIIMGVLIIAFSVYFYSLAVEFRPRSALFPKAILWCMGVTGGLMILDALWRLRKQAPDQDAGLGSALVFQILIPGTIMVLAFGLVRLWGFYAASAFLVFVVFCYHTYRAGEVRLGWPVFARAATFSVMLTGASWVVFSVLLGLPTP